MSFPRYPAYKDSGVEWLGEVPEHWHVEPFKRQIERNDGGVWGDDPDGTDDTIVLRSTEQTVDGQWNIQSPALRRLDDRDKTSTLLVEGDLLLTKSSGSSLHIGKTSLVDRHVGGLRCCFSNFMQRVRLSSTFCPELGWYLLNNRISRLQFDLLSNSSTGLANINAGIIGQIIVPVPPEDEQQFIISFLDHETAKIDALIAEQQRLIELLQEKRQAVISHAVTKGLNPDVPMKDSGVEWLGEVPEHWEIGPIKRISRIYGRIGFRGYTTEDIVNEGEGAVALCPSNLNDNGFNLEKTTFVSWEKYHESPEIKIFEKDVLLVKTGSTYGKVCYVGSLSVPATLNPQMVVFKDIAIESELLCYLLASDFLQACIKVSNKGSALPTITQEAINSFLVPLPPRQEQREILSCLQKCKLEFSGLINQADRAINLLQERRSALISAAVTGQIDVRGLVPEVAAA